MKRFIFVLGFLSLSANAQQTVFNVPNADVLEFKKTYAELDWLYFPARGGEGLRDHFLTLRGVYGIAPNVEAGINVGSIHEGGPAPSILFPVKWKPVSLGESFAFVVGGEAGTTFDPGHFIARGYFKFDWIGMDGKLRAGIGPYAANKNYYQEDSSTGVLATFEAKVSSLVILAADWTSGKHGSGLLSAGTILSLNDGRDLLYFAGVRGNSDRKYGALFEYGRYW